MRSLSLTAALCLAGTVQAADIRVVEEIVAKVNGDIITKGELDRSKLNLVQEMKAQRVPDNQQQEILKEREKDFLRDQIDQLLLVQRGKDMNINVDPDVTRRIAEIQVQSKISDPDKFHAFVKEQTGMTFEDFKSQMKNSLLTQRVIGQEVGSRIAIPEAEKRKYYEEHKQEFIREEQVYLRQIVLLTEGKTPEQQAAIEKKAKDLTARARKGERFGELARDNSDDPETSKNFGELPPYKRGELRKEIEDIVFAQNKGYVTDPIKLPNGWLILRVEERFQKGQAAYEEVEQEITERLYGPRMQPRVREFLTGLRRDAFLEIRAGYLDSGAAAGKDTSWKDPAQLKPQTTTKEEVAANRRKKLLWLVPIPGTKRKAPEADSGMSGIALGDRAGAAESAPPAAAKPAETK